MSQLTDERDKELFEAYEMTLKNLGKYATRISFKARVGLTLKCAAKQHYVTLEEAIRRISFIEKHGDSKAKSDEKRKLYNSLYNKYLFFKQRDSYFNKSALVQMAIDSPAESFFLEIETAIIIIRKMLKL